MTLSVPSSSGNVVRREAAKGRNGGHGLSVPSSSGNVVRRPGLGSGPVSSKPLSVPSSSGNVVRRHVRLWASTVPNFQSPPHRGTWCDSRRRRTPLARYSFSPLLIGERGATRRTGTPRGRSGGFQSPPHRGTWCDRSGMERQPLRGPLPFSPLLIGERGATASGACGQAGARSFQSPPHRGTWCDTLTGTPGPSSPDLSVPSSSGNVVRLPAARAPPDRSRLSVPSSSGNVVRPARYASRLGTALRLSVPSSSGNVVRHERVAPSGHHELPFQSPPHRGTWCDHGLEPIRFRLLLFQSPPHRGTWCDCITWA